MPAMFHSKHQKLILQCYPPGKGIEKKPNSSELSYLLYYASTRRVKLEKVIAFLNKKTVSDSNKNKFGNLQVTLSIVSELIEKCVDNLDVFATDVVSILDLSLKNNDLSLVKAVLQTYGTLCTNLEGGLFAGDKGFVDSMSQFSNKIINVGMNNSKTKSPNSLEWKMISLMACKHLSSCLGYNLEFGREFLTKIMPILINTFHETDQKNSLLAVKSNEDGGRLTKIQLTKSAQVQQHIGDALENDSIDMDDLHDESVAGLNSIFNTSSTSLITEATSQVIRYTFQNSLDQEWKLKFLQLCTTWVPVQLRFAVLSTLISNLIKLSSAENVKVDLQKHYANHLSGLLKSNVNMIGLSISDLIQNVLDLTQNLYFKQADKIKEDELHQLSQIYEDIITNIATHVYYFDQVPDSVYEIFFKISSTLEFSADEDPNKVYNYVMVLLDCVANILETLTEAPSKSNINRNHVGLDHWQLSLMLIEPKDLNKLYASLSAEQVNDIQLSYLQIFDTFLTKELKTSTELKANTNTIDFLSPDFNELISESTNFVSCYLVFLNHCLNSTDMDTSVCNGFLIISNHLASIFGVNFLNNFIPFYLHWILPEVSEDASEPDLIKDNFAEVVLKNSLEIIENKYSDDVAQYILKSDFFTTINQNINYKIKNDLWMEEFVPTTNISKSFKASFTALTRKEMHDFIAGNEFLTKWLNAQKPLILNVLTDDLLDQDKNGHSNGHSNGHPNHITVDSSSNSSHDEFKSNLGLGKLADIASIHSGLRNSSASFNGNGNSFNGNGNVDHSNGSIMTDKILPPPKVSDIKDLLTDHKPDTSTTPGSVLSKQMATRNVDSILDDLDDDEEFIV